MAQLSIGTTLGGYRIEQIAGRGGMGVVYRAEQLALGRQVALKVISPELAEDPGFRERFKHESRIAASIDHPNVIAVHEAGEVDGLLFLSMRYVEGTDLRGLIRELGRVPLERATHILTQVADALDAAHARGLVHRDVKPANILIAAGGNDHAYLTDFGLTKHLASASGLTNTGQWVGTADYVAPEQIQGDPIDARTDVYALGCVLYELLTGTVPFPRDNQVAKIYAHLSEPPPQVDCAALGLPAGLDHVVRRAMAKRPDERFPSAGDLARATVAAIEQRPLEEPERTVATGSAAPVRSGSGATRVMAPPAHARRTPSWLPAVLAGAVLALFVGGAVALATGAFEGGDAMKTPTTASSAATASITAGAKIPADRVQAVIDAYRTALENENLDALDGLFSAGFKQREKGKGTTDREASLQSYQEQFDNADNPRVDITNVSISSDKTTAAASGSFTAAADGQAVIDGSIEFYMIAAGDRLAIDEIVIAQ
jgi:hypothetical protein